MIRLERVFLAIDCDVETRAAQIAQLDVAFPSGSMPGKPTPPTNWHITLRWLGDVAEVTLECLMAELDQAELGTGFRLRLTGLGMFPHPERAGVLWRAVDDRDGRVAGLAEAVDQACEGVGLPPEGRPFVPHLTLSRLRPQRDLSHLLDTGLHVLSMPVTSVTVFRSVPDRPNSSFEVIESIELG